MYSVSYYQTQLANAKTPLEVHFATSNLKKAMNYHRKRKLQRIQANQELQASMVLNAGNDVYEEVSEPTVEDAPKKRGRKPKEQ